MITRRKLGRFVVQALKCALNREKQALKEAYTQASKDPDRLETIKEWEKFEEDVLNRLF